MQCSVLFVLIFVFYVEAALPTVPPLKLPTIDELRARIAQNIANRPTLSPQTNPNLSIPPLANRVSTTPSNRTRLVLKTLTPAPQVTSTTPTSVTPSAPSPVVPPPTPAPSPSPTTKHLVLNPPSVTQATSDVKPRLGAEDEVKASPAQRDVKPRVDGENDSNSSFDYGDFVRLRGFMRDVPRGNRLRHLGRNVMRRAMHSFINNDEHNLEGISPTLDNIHHVFNTMGRLILPHPDHLSLLTDKVPSLLPEYVYQRSNTARNPEKSDRVTGLLNNNQEPFGFIRELSAPRNSFENKYDEEQGSIFGNKNQGLFGRNSIFGNRENRLSFLSPKNTLPGLFGGRKETLGLLEPRKILGQQNKNEELMDQIDSLDDDDLIGQNLKRISSRLGQRIKILQ